MNKLTQTIDINASREQVWDAIVNDAKYREWTAEFHQGSYFEGAWSTGDTIRFLALDEKGEKSGMLATIHSAIYPEFISIQHLGLVANGVDDTTSEEVKKWAPAFENYTLKSIDNTTTQFVVDVDSNEEYYDYFLEVWPRALAKLKEICERTI
ncbi:MAG: SRPBCC domain-containing protein [Candidatus Kapabacteria bacterium]|nr:SRPBCC domain-containing protein [Candidatus Kapabacteria bacterium]